MTDPAFYCSEYSLAVGEQLFGTAPRVQMALILEFNGRWEPEVLDSAGLPDDVRAWLGHHTTAFPDAKIWFIRRGKDAPPRPELMFYVALIRETNPVLYAFSLARYEDLLALDLPAIAAETHAYAAHRHADPLILVCTHGRRDRCCARYGPSAFDRLAQAWGDQVWQSSHVGGHRLAANVVALPYGIYYGRVNHALPALVEALQAGHVALDAYRGRACYPKLVQVADYFLRRMSGITTLEAFRLIDMDQHAPDQWRVQFVEAATATRHVVHLRAAESELLSYMSCGDAEPESVTQYQLAEYLTHSAS